MKEKNFDMDEYLIKCKILRSFEKLTRLIFE